MSAKNHCTRCGEDMSKARQYLCSECGKRLCHTCFFGSWHKSHCNEKKKEEEGKTV